ncbi:MAG TPA: hypothetical protein VLG47_06600 [Candidatus Saccharimonadales bacterium]|nr:hypothetical protein [Candidatus Saccharimonadales bacterium]
MKGVFGKLTYRIAAIIIGGVIFSAALGFHIVNAHYAADQTISKSTTKAAQASIGETTTQNQPENTSDSTPSDTSSDIPTATQTTQSDVAPSENSSPTPPATPPVDQCKILDNKYSPQFRADYQAALDIYNSHFTDGSIVSPYLAEYARTYDTALERAYQNYSNKLILAGCTPEISWNSVDYMG